MRLNDKGKGNNLSRDLSPLTRKVGYATVYFRRHLPTLGFFSTHGPDDQGGEGEGRKQRW
jgi:hypothetical protein